MPSPSPSELVRAAKQSMVRVDAGRRERDTWLERERDTRVVLIGEASHGTHELYADRAALSARLTEEQGFAPWTTSEPPETYPSSV